MNRKRKSLLAVRLICSALTIAFILCSLPIMAKSAEIQAQKTIRVGFFAFDGYHIIDENGQRSGYGYDFLQYMSGYTYWKYEYIGYERGWGEMQEMLENGEIDLLTSVQKTEERERRFDFSAQPIGTSSAILTVKVGNTKYLSGEYQNWSGMRIGMLNGNSRNDRLSEYAAANGFTYEPVYFDDSAEMINELKNGSGIDAALTSDLRAIHDEWVIAKFAPSDFYIMVKKGNNELLDEINAALEQLYTDDPNIRTKLWNLYYLPDSGDEIAFTSEERKFIEDMSDTVFTAVINPDRTPYSYYVNGKPAGIISDIAGEIIQRSGLNIEFIDTADRAEYREAVYSDAVDIRFDAWHNLSEAESQGYHLTNAFIDASISRLSLHESVKNDKIALLRDADLSTKYYQQFKSAYNSIFYYDTIEELVNAVLKGEVDAGYLYTRTCEQYERNDVRNRLVSKVMFNGDLEFCAAVKSDRSSLLYSILNKCVSSLSEEEIAGYVNEYTTYEKSPFSIVKYIYNNPFFLVIVVAVFFIIFFLAAAALLFRNKQRHETMRLKEESRRSDLLSDALRTAEKATAAKSTFLSRVSHEIRTPLNAIIGFIELSDGADEASREEYRLNCLTASKQLLSVINDVLDMSAIESGKMNIAHSPFNFKQLIHSITNIYLLQCQDKGLEFDTFIENPIDDWLIGDQLRVNQILINLLGNAVKFTEKGYVRLNISSQVEKDDRVFIRFVISDTGCGMSEEMIGRLFNAFEQESTDTARKYGGSGLGLSIVKNLVSMMDGAVSVTSKRGSGTTFTVDLPFTRSDQEVNFRISDGTDNLKVLAVDDTPSEGDYISEILTRLNIKHCCVKSGSEALAEFDRAAENNDCYNICLIDWKMPDMDGFELTRRIRTKYGKNVVVIVVSAYERHQAEAHMKEAGADLFVTKPLFKSSLLDMFMSFTGGSFECINDKPKAADVSGMRVLLAEDNVMNRKVATAILKKIGVEYDTAEDGKIASDMFIASEPGYYDAILMDIQMPNMDGYEAAKRIRQSEHPCAESISIIALSANAFNEDIAKSLSNGMNDHVSKPIDASLLSAALKKANDRKAGLGNDKNE